MHHIAALEMGKMLQKRKSYKCRRERKAEGWQGALKGKSTR
jgi:hypothetical protein